MSEANQIERPVSQHRHKCWHNLKEPTMTEDQIARVCHEVNRAYCQALGDNSQPSWEDAPQWQRDSALLGVRLHTDNPEASAAASHESWMAQKVAEGWVYGPEKNPELKHHHCIVPFDDLPVAQQAKDFIFRGVVHALGEYRSAMNAIHEQHTPTRMGEPLLHNAM